MREVGFEPTHASPYGSTSDRDREITHVSESMILEVTLSLNPIATWNR